MPHDQIDQYWGMTWWMRVCPSSGNTDRTCIRFREILKNPFTGRTGPDCFRIHLPVGTTAGSLLPKATPANVTGPLALLLHLRTGELQRDRQLTGQGLHYQTIEAYPKLMPDFELLHAEETTYTLYFENAREVLRHIKATGVNGLQASMKVADLMRFQREYQKQFQAPKGVSLTYHAIYIIAKAR